MPLVKFTSDNPEDTYHLRRFDGKGTPKETICFCDEAYPEDKMRGGVNYGTEHKLTSEEVARLGVHTRNGNLTIVEEKKKKADK